MTFNEFCVICNKNIQYLLYSLVRNIYVRGENRKGNDPLSRGLKCLGKPPASWTLMLREGPTHNSRITEIYGPVPS